MSTFLKITKHPISGEYKKAIWIDDYFGSHLYGVGFRKDGKDVDIFNFKKRDLDIFKADKHAW